MTHDTDHTVIVSFTTTAENHDAARDQITAYIGSFLSQQPGFVASWLHESTDGKSLVHYARWRTQADFKAAGTKARAHPDLPALMRYKPSGQEFRVYRSFKP
jgi:hypothetical protein